MIGAGQTAQKLTAKELWDKIDQLPKSNVLCLVVGFSDGRFAFFLTGRFFLTRHFVATFLSLTNTTSQKVGNAASHRVINNVLAGVWDFQTGLGLDSLGFGNELGHELLEIIRVTLK